MIRYAINEASWNGFENIDFEENDISLEVQARYAGSPFVEQVRFLVWEALRSLGLIFRPKRDFDIQTIESDLVNWFTTGSSVIAEDVQEYLREEAEEECDARMLAFLAHPNAQSHLLRLRVFRAEGRVFSAPLHDYYAVLALMLVNEAFQVDSDTELDQIHRSAALALEAAECLMAAREIESQDFGVLIGSHNASSETLSKQALRAANSRHRNNRVVRKFAIALARLEIESAKRTLSAREIAARIQVSVLEQAKREDVHYSEDRFFITLQEWINRARKRDELPT